MLLFLNTLCSHVCRKLSKINIRTYATEKFNTHCWRSHTCGELRHTDIGKPVTLCGWVEFYRPKRFVVIRDWHGRVQLLLKSGNAKNISLESVVKAVGVVKPRPQKDVNPDMDSGDIEVHVEKLDILNHCSNLPFQIHDFEHKNEDTRMKYRYLDIRTKLMQHNLRIRSSLISSMREFLLHNHGFVEIETPTLFRPTPGGAREFLVPSSNDKGMFYSLPQSPQQFKQLLMVGGIDRYFQVARCYRDEGAKPDRQPEFTQLDLELSFVSAEDVMSVTESMVKCCWPNNLGYDPFPRMTFKDAIDKYGSDKPDTRFQLHLTDVTEVFRTVGVSSYSNTAANSLVVPQDYAKLLEGNIMEKVYDANKSYFGENSMENCIFSLRSGTPVKICGSDISDSCLQKISAKLNVKENDLVWIAWGSDSESKTLLGKARLLVADALEEAGMTLRDEDTHKFLWVNDFPLFEYGSDGDLQCVHHPFTAPHPDDIHLLETDPVKVRSLAYDLVLNGNEVGGGSIRIHHGPFQRRILNEFLKINPSQLEHLLQALDSGAPPHGGIALGLDRLIAVLCKANSIRDVIAFPKSSSGKDLMCGAPCKAAPETLKLFSQTESF